MNRIEEVFVWLSTIGSLKGWLILLNLVQLKICSLLFSLLIKSKNEEINRLARWLDHQYASSPKVEKGANEISK